MHTVHPSAAAPAVKPPAPTTNSLANPAAVFLWWGGGGIFGAGSHARVSPKIKITDPAGYFCDGLEFTFEKKCPTEGDPVLARV